MSLGDNELKTIGHALLKGGHLWSYDCPEPYFKKWRPFCIGLNCTCRLCFLKTFLKLNTIEHEMLGLPVWPLWGLQPSWMCDVTWLQIQDGGWKWCHTYKMASILIRAKRIRLTTGMSNLKVVRIISVVTCVHLGQYAQYGVASPWYVICVRTGPYHDDRCGNIKPLSSLFSNFFYSNTLV